MHASANQYQTVKQILRYENICLHSSSRMFFRFSETLLFLQHHAHCLETCSIVAARSRKHAMQNYHSEYLLALKHPKTSKNVDRVSLTTYQALKSRNLPLLLIYTYFIKCKQDKYTMDLGQLNLSQQCCQSINTLWAKKCLVKK